MLCVQSGGNWNNASNAGVWTASLNNTRTNSNNNVGFRADYMLQTQKCDSSVEGDNFLLFRAKSLYRLFSSRSRKRFGRQQKSSL